MIIAIAVFFAAIAATFTGFGFNLAAVPLLALVLLPHDAVSVALMLGVCVSGLTALVSARRGEIDASLVLRLTLWSVPGLLVGVVLLRYLDPNLLRSVIGAITVLCAIGLVASQYLRMQPTIVRDSVGVGLLGGSLTAVTGTGGPPVAAYLMVLPMAPSVVRGTLVTYITLVSLLALGWRAAIGDLTMHEFGVSARLTPAVIAGLLLGAILFRRSSAVAYRRVSYVTLLLIGVSGLILAIR